MAEYKQEGIDTTDPLLASNAFQDSLFVRGYVMCRIKNGQNPLPSYGNGSGILPATEDYKKWMTGWNSGLVELGLIQVNVRGQE